MLLTIENHALLSSTFFISRYFKTLNFLEIDKSYMHGEWINWFDSIIVWQFVPFETAIYWWTVFLWIYLRSVHFHLFRSPIWLPEEEYHKNKAALNFTGWQWWTFGVQEHWTIHLVWSNQLGFRMCPAETTWSLRQSSKIHSLDQQKNWRYVAFHPRLKITRFVYRLPISVEIYFL